MVLGMRGIRDISPLWLKGVAEQSGSHGDGEREREEG